jgi:hypothetical protein
MPNAILFPSQPFEPKAVDYDFADQFEAARESGATVALINQDQMEEGRFEQAVARIGLPPGSSAIYRGWMLPVAEYAKLYSALRGRDIQLINTPDQYEHCHHLPASYNVIEQRTAKSVWTSGGGAPPIDEVMDLLEIFGDGPVVLKDYVKSQKHRWEDACFVPHANDQTAVKRVVDNFAEYVDRSPTGGLVFREFLELDSVGVHSKSGMPLTNEYRLFFFDGAPLVSAPYWDEGTYDAQAAPVDEFVAIAEQVQSRFFTMDVARKRTGEWAIIELGDGQVAGLLDTIPPAQFYSAIVARA